MQRSGEENQKFSMLYRSYHALMQKTAMAVLHDFDLAEDAVQNAFLQLAPHMEQLDGENAQATKRYMRTAARNAAIDLYRKRKMQWEKEICISDAPTIWETAQEEATDFPEAMWDALPPKYRVVFELKYGKELSNAEIARTCGIREGTVRQRLSRGRQLLKQRMPAMTVVIFALCMTVTMSVYAYRTAFFETTKTVVENCVLLSYAFLDKEPAGVYGEEPSYVPDGYRQTEAKKGADSCTYEYCNGQGKYLIFQQHRISNGEKALFDATYDSTAAFSTASGATVSVYSYNDETFWAYAEDQDSVYLLAGHTIPAEELQTIYENWLP